MTVRYVLTDVSAGLRIRSDIDRIRIMDPDPTSQDKPDPDPDPTFQDKPDPDPDTSVLKICHLFYDEF